MISPSSFSRAASSASAEASRATTKAMATWPLSGVGHADHRHLGDVRVAGDALLDLARAQPVAGDVDHVVGAAQDVEIAVLVADAPVEGAVDLPARDGLPVGLDEALVVAPDGLHEARRRRALDHHHALLVGLGQLLAGALVHQLDVVAVHGHARAAELAGLLLHAVGDGQDRPAAFGLPVVVDDGHAQAVADPARGGLVQRLAGQEQRLQAGQVVLLQEGRVLLLEHAHRRRRAEHRA